MARMQSPKATVEEIIADWPEKTPGQQQHPKETARKMIDKYGQPDEVTPSRLIWYDNGPWKRTEVHRDGPRHRFPIPHIDHLYQFIDYQVPPEKHDELAAFDGSLLVRRTEGELGVTCHKEPANILALNLAHDVMTGKKTVEGARDAYAKINAKMMAGSPPKAAREFQFQLPEGDQRDPDVTIVTDEIKRNRDKLLLGSVLLAGIVLLAARRSQTGQSQSGSEQSDRSKQTETARP